MQEQRPSTPLGEGRVPGLIHRFLWPIKISQEGWRTFRYLALLHLENEYNESIGPDTADM
jgi:hypothetical protein